MELLSYLPYLLIPIITSIVITLMTKNAKKAEKDMDASDFVVQQPKFAFWLGIFCMLLFSVGPVIVSFFTDDTIYWWVVLIFALFSLSGAYLAVYCKLWKLEVTGNEMRFSTLTKRNEVYKFEDVKRVRLKNQGSSEEKIVIFGETRKLYTVEINCPGYNVLIARLKQAGIKFE